VSVSFDVEEAGCESCATIIGGVLARLATVESIEIDEDADRAAVVLSGEVSPDAIDQALAEASAGAGHAYRVRPGSWRSGGGGPKTAPAGDAPLA
jgi:copper chaperone CopZ